MARMSIAQLRQRAAKELAMRKNPDPSETDIEEARSIMNAYYRLAALDGRICELQNDERKCNLASTRRAEESAERRLKKLQKRLEPYDACIIYAGIYPSICKAGTTQDLFLTHFYG